MIPLLRPTLPNSKQFNKYFNWSKKNFKYTNFGPCFEAATKQLNKLTGKFCLITNSGTSAITVALQTKLNVGAKVLIPDFTHMGTLQAVVAAHMQPIIAGVEKATWTISVEAIRKAHKEFKIDAFIVVSPFGYYVDFEKYDGIAEELKIKVIYDLAGAWGLEAKTDNPTCYSLHATKNFSCGEGGIICFSEEDLWFRGRALTNFDTNPDRTCASIYGYNNKPDEIKCAIILAWLDDMKKLEAKWIAKNKLVELYQTFLNKLCVPHNRYIEGATSLCVLAGFDSKKLSEAALAEGIEIKPYYILLSEMPFIKDLEVVSVSGPYFRTTCALPSDVSEKEFYEVIEFVKSNTA